MRRCFRLPAVFLSSALVGLLVLLAPAPSAAAVPLILPDGEPEDPWRAALPLGGQMTLELGLVRVVGSPWVELERTANLARWRLRVRDEAGVLHEVEVGVPSDGRAREEVVALAASLLHPVAECSGFWPGVPVVEEAPPPPPRPPVQPPRAVVATPRSAEPALPPVAAPAVAEPAQPAAASLAVAAEPQAEVTGASPAPLSLPAAAPVPPAATPELPPPAPRLVVWSRLAGSADLGLGLDGPAAGGGVQAGLVVIPTLRAGLGFQAEGRQVFEVQGLAQERRPAQRDTDLFGVVSWNGGWRVAPLLAARGGWTVRRAYVRERSDQGSWTWQEVVDEDGDALAPLPFAGLETGLSVPLGGSLHLEPYAQAQLLLVQAVDSALFAPGVEGSFPRFSAHVGLALRLEPGT